MNDHICKRIIKETAHVVRKQIIIIFHSKLEPVEATRSRCYTDMFTIHPAWFPRTANRTVPSLLSSLWLGPPHNIYMPHRRTEFSKQFLRSPISGSNLSTIVTNYIDFAFTLSFDSYKSILKIIASCKFCNWIQEKESIFMYLFL